MGTDLFRLYDAPVILYQSPSLKEFLSELFKLSMPPYKSLVDDVRGDRLFEVWRKNPGVRDYAECMGAGDPELSSFAGQLSPTFQFVDMRNPAVGFGFSWVATVPIPSSNAMAICQSLRMRKERAFCPGFSEIQRRNETMQFTKRALKGQR